MRASAYGTLVAADAIGIKKQGEGTVKSGNGFVSVDYESGQDSSMVKRSGLRLLKMGRYRAAQRAVATPRPAADVLVVGPGGSYDHDLGLLAAVVAHFGGIDRKAHRWALVRSVFFIIEFDYPSVAVGL
jgi:hypothetical protein